MEFDSAASAEPIAFHRVSPGVTALTATLGSPKILVAVGLDGAIMRSLNGGRTWEVVARTGTNSDLASVLAVPGSPGTLVAVGGSGTIVRSVDDGQTWNAVGRKGAPYGLESVQAVPAAPHTIVAVGGAIVRSSDDGQTWNAVTQTGTQAPLNSVLPLPGAPHRLLATGASTIIRSEDDGQTWVSVAEFNTNFFDRSFAGSKSAVAAVGHTVLFVGARGVMARSLDDGKTWNTVGENRTASNLVCIVASPSVPDTLVALGGGSILRSTDSGLDWSLATPIDELPALDAVVVAPDAVHTWVAAGASGTILRSVDDGRTWNKAVVPSNAYDSFASLLPVPETPHSLVAVGAGRIVRSTDDGQTWENVSEGTNFALLGVLVVPSAPRTLVGFGQSGTIIRSVDAGENWRGVSRESIEADVADVIATPDAPHTLIAVGGLEIARSIDDGQTWASIRPSGAVSVLFNVVATPDAPHTLVAVGNVDILRSVDDGRTWTKVASPESLLYRAIAVPGSPHTLVAVGGFGLIARSLDDGETWSSIRLRDTLALTRVLAVPSAPHTLLAIGQDAVIVRSVDDGKTWSEVARFDQGKGTNLLSGISAVPGAPHTLVAVGGSTGEPQTSKIVRSVDDGQTWSSVGSSGTNVPLETIISVPDAPHMLVAVGGQGTVVRSIDDGDTWSAIVPAPTNVDLVGAAALPGPSHTLVAVGSRGAIVRSESIRAPTSLKLTAAMARYSHGGTGNPLLELQFAGLPDKVTISGLSEQDYSRLTTAVDRVKSARILDPKDITQQSSNDGTRVIAVLNPEEFSAKAPDPLYMSVLMEGSGFSFRYPGGERFFQIPNHPKPISSWVLGLITAALLAILLLVLTNVRPLFVLRVACTPAVWDAADKSGIPGLAGFATLVASKLLLPLLLRNGRVLDAWIDQNRSSLKEAFDKTASEITGGDSSSYWPLPVLVGKERATPTPDFIRTLIERRRICIQIVATGGAGKTRLALQFGQWLFEDRIVSISAVAMLIDEEFDDLWNTIRSRITAIVGVNAAIPDEFLKTLLETGRLWIIVDRLSERNKSTREAFSRVYEKASPNVLICTSRQTLPMRVIKPSLIEPLPLDRDSLLGFLGDQLRSEKAGELFPSLDEQGKLVQRLARQITLDEKELPITPLLVKVFVSEAVALARRLGPTALESLPDNIPDAYFSYVERLDSTISGANDYKKGSAPAIHARRAAAVVAFIELGEDFRSKPVPRQRVLDALQERASILGSEDYLERMTASGLLVERFYGSEVMTKFVLDPLAECLAANEHAVRCGSSADEWTSLIDRVVAHGQSAGGFLLALKMNHEAFGQALNFPDVDFPVSVGVHDDEQSNSKVGRDTRDPLPT